VRGEYLQPWGVAEAQRLGVLDVLLEAGGNVVTRMVPYDETVARRQPSRPPSTSSNCSRGCPARWPSAIRSPARRWPEQLPTPEYKSSEASRLWN
jgi:hypothetical protein